MRESNSSTIVLASRLDAGRVDRAFFGTEPSGCWPRPSRPRWPSGSTAHAHLTGRARPSPGGPQRVPAQADDYRPASGRWRSSSRGCWIDAAAGGSGALLLQDSAAVPAEDQEHRGVDSLAVPQGHQHGRFQRGLGRRWSVRKPAACRPRRSRGSRRSGKTNTRSGANDPWKASSTSTCGPTASTSTSAWRKIGSASWC